MRSRSHVLLGGVEPADDERPCIGYSVPEDDDEPCEMCKGCKACSGNVMIEKGDGKNDRWTKKSTGIKRRY